MNILITGGTGFIGRHLVPHLQALGHDIRCAVWKHVPWLHAQQVIVNRLESKIDWTQALDNIDVVIHLAARVHILDNQNNLSMNEFIKINSEATKNLAEQAAQCKVKRFIFLSSIKVNGESTRNDELFTQAENENPIDDYAQSKWLAEQYLQTISQSTGLEMVILRPPLVYGPGVKANFRHLLNIVHQGWPLPFGNINNKRTFVYIDNLVSAIQTVLTAPQASGHCFLIADNESWSLTELLREIASAMDRTIYLFPIPTQTLSFLFKLFRLKRLSTRLFGSLLVSNQKLQDELGWQPPVHSTEGIRKTVQWYQKERKHLEIKEC